MEYNKGNNSPILVTGASGFIGREFLSKIDYLEPLGMKFSSKYDSKKNMIKIDLRSETEVKNIFDKYKPRIIYHFAALTSPATNEKNIKFARESHMNITQNILRNISTETHLIYLSTDKVFDGVDPYPDENTIPHPIWTYGKFKLSCENMIKEKLERYHILRLPIVHSVGNEKSNSFIDKALIQIKNKKAVSVYNNVFRCYIRLSELMRLLEKTLYDDHYGIYHVGTKMMSYYKRLKELCIENNINYEGLVQSVEAEKNIVRPMKQNLNTNKARRIFGIKFT